MQQHGKPRTARVSRFGCVRYFRDWTYSMTKNGRNGTPAYKRIQGVIWKRIETGQLKPGDAVDWERELARIPWGKSDDRTSRPDFAGTRRNR